MFQRPVMKDFKHLDESTEQRGAQWPLPNDLTADFLSVLFHSLYEDVVKFLYI